MASNQATSTRLGSIESLRGLAALMIVFYHLVELAQLPLPPGLQIVRTHFGMGVPLFYTLSGFVLAFGYADKLTLGRAETASFYVGRFFRIAPLFYTVLVGWRVLGWLLWSWPISSQSLFLNLTFLFGLVPGEHESLVMAGWSIGIEMLFYLIFPVLIVFLRGVRSTIVGLVLSLVLSAATSNAYMAAGLGSYAYMNLVTQMPFFIAGMACFRVWQARGFNHGRYGWGVLAAAMLLIVLMVKDNYLYQMLQDLRFGALHHNIWSIVFGLLIYAVCTLDLSWLNRGALRWFGRMSFSAYLLHPLVMVALIKIGVIVWLSRLEVWLAFSLGSTITLALVCAVSYASYRWIELPGIALGKQSRSHKFGEQFAALGSWALMSSRLPMPLRAQANPRLDKVGYFSLSAVGARLKANRTVQRIGNTAVWSHALRGIMVGAFFFVTYITFRHIQQPLVDVHAFRQTQTALTAHWMLKEGWAFAYQTPVAGFPWSIPFEFPIYQALVAAIVALSGFELSAVGRFVSYAFLVACAWPAFALSQRLDLPKSVPWVFCALLWTSPLNVYWGRTFMIETAALFFAFACMPYAIDLIRRVGGWRSVLLFVAFATAAVLQKATTGGPVLLFLLLAAAFVHVRQSGLGFQALRRLLYPTIVIGMPLAIGLAWAHYTDVVKMANPFGRQLTSGAPTTWNFGSMEQKLDFKTWQLVVWERSLGWNAGGLLGALLLLLPWLGGREHRRFAWLSLAAFTLFLLPVLIFTNLHIVHEYYQVGCVAFLLAALAIVIGGWLKEVSGTMAIVPIMTLAIILSNMVFFNSTYGIVAARSVDEQDLRSVQAYKVGHYLREHTRPDTGLVIFGQSYSSEIGFQAQRKSMTVPPWFKEYERLWKNPQAYLGDLQLSAIVICPPTNQFPSMADLQERLIREPAWVRETVHGCELLFSPTMRVPQ